MARAANRGGLFNRLANRVCPKTNRGTQPARLKSAVSRRPGLDRQPDLRFSERYHLAVTAPRNRPRPSPRLRRSDKIRARNEQPLKSARKTRRTVVALALSTTFHAVILAFILSQAAPEYQFPESIAPPMEVQIMPMPETPPPPVIIERLPPLKPEPTKPQPPKPVPPTPQPPKPKPPEPAPAPPAPIPPTPAPPKPTPVTPKPAPPQPAVVKPLPAPTPAPETKPAPPAPVAPPSPAAPAPPPPRFTSISTNRRRRRPAASPPCPSPRRPNRPPRRPRAPRRRRRAASRRSADHG